MSGGNKTTGTQTTTSSQPGVNDVLGTAKTIFDQGTAWKPDTTSHVSPFSTQQTKGLTGMQGVAQGAVTPFAQNFSRINATVSDGGLNALQDQQVRSLQGVAGGNGMNAEQKLAYNRLDPIAGGSMMSGNPYMEDLIKRGSQDIANSSNLMASAAGRYGSGSHQGVTEKSIGDFTGDVRYKNYGDEASRRDAAIRDMFGMGTTGQGQKMDAIGSLFNAGTQQRQNVLAGTGQLQSAYDARLAPYQTMLGVGGAYQGQNQKIIDDATRVQQDRKDALTGPVDWLANLANAFQGGQQIQTGYKPDDSVKQGIGGALGTLGATGNPLLGLLGGIGGFL